MNFEPWYTDFYDIHEDENKSDLVCDKYTPNHEDENVSECCLTCTKFEKCYKEQIRKEVNP